MVKLCECGCGMPAPIAMRNDKSKGWVKGQPIRFINNHHARLENNPNWRGGISQTEEGYILLRSPEHPKATKAGYVRSHRLRAEKALGRILPDKVPIHHHDVQQIVICEDQAYHMLLHVRTRAFRACGHPDWRKCDICKKYDAPEKLITYSNSSYHLSCRNKYQTEKRHIRLFSKAESIVGKPLPKGVLIYYPIGIQNDSTFAICQNFKYLILLRRREAALKSCGHASWRQCQFCRDYDHPDNLYIGNRRAYHRICQNQSQNKRRSLRGMDVETGEILVGLGE